MKSNTAYIGRICTLLLSLSAPLVSRAQTPVIVEATVNPAKGYIALAGTNFSPTNVKPTVSLGGNSLTVFSFTNTKVVAVTPASLAAGTYLVILTNSASLSVPAYVTVGAGTVALPFTGSVSSTSTAAFDIANTSPAQAAVAGMGGQAASGGTVSAPTVGGGGVVGFGGGSNGGSSGGTSKVSFGGEGIYGQGGPSVDLFDTGGAGVSAKGGSSGATSGGFGGTGLVAQGGNADTQAAGNGIQAYGGNSTSGGAGAGIFAQAGSGTGPFAGVFNGDVHVSGNLSKTAGSFKIDHPLDPANKYLYHSFVESPDMMNIYNGNVVTDGSGTAVVTMPTWFEALNTDFRYQLTVIGQFAQAIVASEVANRSFIIKTNKPNVKVSWQVTGIRQDAWANAHRIPVEVDKAPQDQGHYLHPELFGHEGEPNIAERHHPRPPQAQQ
jgi:hypothetical protein